MGLSQLAAASVLEVPQGRLSEWERGLRRPGRLNAVRIEKRTAGLVPVEAWDDLARKAS